MSDGVRVREGIESVWELLAKRAVSKVIDVAGKYYSLAPAQESIRFTK
jgi:hypothetical protein